MARKIKISVSGQTSSIYLMCSDCPSGQKPSWNGISLADFLSSSNLYSNTVEIEVDNNGVLLLPYGRTNNKFYSYTIEGDTKLSKDETLIINIRSYSGTGTFRLETINITLDLNLTEYLTNIANAIRAKKSSTEKINAQDFVSEIENLSDEESTYSEILRTNFGDDSIIDDKTSYELGYEAGSADALKDVTTLKNLLDAKKTAAYLFRGFTGESAENLIKYDDTNNVTDFTSMFNGCQPLKIIPSINTSKGTIFEGMFSDCNSITSIPSLDTINATNMKNMFYACRTIEKIDISHYKISSSSSGYSSEIWGRNYRLKALIIRSFGTSYVIEKSAFNYCFHMLGTKDADFNPNGDHDGYVYVPRDMIATLQSATNWSQLQFRALEDYTKDGTTTGEFDDEKAGI